MNEKMASIMQQRLNERAALDRSAWDHGVTAYTNEIMNNLNEHGETDFPTYASLESAMLNGASDWLEASEGGCYLVYDEDIAERLCTPSELKKNHHGDHNPNNKEDWLHVQARALYQASKRITSAWLYYQRNCVND